MYHIRTTKTSSSATAVQIVSYKNRKMIVAAHIGSARNSEELIEAHILICFMALAVCKYMEIKTAKSTKQIVRILRSVTDARIENTLTGEEIIMRSEITAEVKEILSKFTLSY